MITLTASLVRSISMRGMPDEPNSLETWSRIFLSCKSRRPKSFFVAYQRERQGSIVPRRKPVGWIFCPMVFESGARGSGLLRPFFFFAFADLDGQVRESLRERHRAALRTRAETQAVVEQRADVGAALGDVE